jgi:hypothetical protein
MNQNPSGEKPVNTATLSRMIRDHRTGQVHLPHEVVTVLGMSENLRRDYGRI